MKKILICLIAVTVLFTGVSGDVSNPVGGTSGEVFALAESHEHALRISEEYGLDLLSYSWGIAVFAADYPEKVADNYPMFEISRTYHKSGLISPPENAGQWHHKSNNSYDAWEYSDGANVVVAIIDTGIDIYHPDFEGRISELSYNSVTGKIGIEAVIDDWGHGTTVAGILAGTSGIIETEIFGEPREYYISGVAPAAELLIIKANNPNTSEFDNIDVMRAINYAVTNGADIVNMSIGCSYYDEDGDCAYIESENQIMKNAVNKGVVLIAAVGNDSEPNAGFPAAYEDVIAVSATTFNYAFADDFSNYGDEIDISAPGHDIIAAKRGGDLRMVFGTSAAAPSVSGTAALLKSMNPALTPAEIKDLLIFSAKKVGDYNENGWSPYYGYGVLDTGKTVSTLLKKSREYTINDAMQILRYLAKLKELSH
ncbi:MAG: S8 family serine peptidase, partial [Oscillospiraceae bacterium]|nr:S8 family serine peptidase [Oscillospiraceae bacterium]